MEYDKTYFQIFIHLYSFIFLYIISYPLSHVFTFSESYLISKTNRIIFFNQNFEYNSHHWLTAVPEVEKLNEVSQGDDLVVNSTYFSTYAGAGVCMNDSVCTCVGSPWHNCGYHFLGVNHLDFFFWVYVSHWTRARQVGYTRWPERSEISLILPPQPWDYECVSPCPSFACGPRGWKWGQAFSRLSKLSGPCSAFYSQGGMFSKK